MFPYLCAGWGQICLDGISELYSFQVEQQSVAESQESRLPVPCRLESHPSHGAWWELVEECGDGDAEAAADLQEREEAGVALAALHRGDVVEVHARKLGELLLREPVLLAQAAHRST